MPKLHPFHLLATAVLLGLTLPPARAQQPDLASLSLENLSSTQVLSVSRKEQKLNDAAAAVFVISSEDIRRSGLSNIAELLRTVPGLEVAQLDGSRWAITSRGLNERYADRILVLLDGRALHTPVTSGVDWDVQEPLLEDVDRIEVVRGPGATLWGSNAMNGVINIITKKAQDTPGTLVTGVASVHERNTAAIRFGSTLGSNGHFRIFAKYLHRPACTIAAADDWSDLRGGFRADWDLPGQTGFTLIGEGYGGHAGEFTDGLLSADFPFGDPRPDRTFMQGGNLTARWSRHPGRLDTEVQSFATYGHRHEPGALEDTHFIFDLDLNQHLVVRRGQSFNWGANFRYNIDRTVGSFAIHYTPADRSVQLYGAFFQYDFAPLPGRLRFTAGAKLEHSFYVGPVGQPSLRAIWTPSSRVSLWASSARAAATPSRIDSELASDSALFPDGAGNLLLSRFSGTLHLLPETVNAFELGFRIAPHPRLSLDLATFLNHYDNLHTNEPGTPFLDTKPGPLPTHFILPITVQSNGFGHSRGLEVLLTAQPIHTWKLTASYTGSLIQIGRNAISQDLQSQGETSGSTPRTQFQLHSFINLPQHLELDTALYVVSRLEAGTVAPYARLDLRAGWRPSSALELSLGGRNLLQSSHMEFPSQDLVAAAPVRRSAFVKATWRF